ncbi:helix-turn-helix domain-containing protein [Comamonas sp. GB3 AK4-5]|uniref:helix-turn-helix transcriptional regulator n=1 Tax=Comamonas sp. GB3 AK4-5 TaxID=3231487 RepID=UPI00351E70C8
MASLLACRPPRWMGLGTLRACDFGAPDLSFLDAEVQAQQVLMAGHVQALQLQRGLWLHGVEASDLCTLRSSVPAEPGLHLVVLLEGRVDVAFGGQRLQMQVDPLAGPQTGACGAVVHSRPGDAFVRRWQRGKYERKLSLSVEPCWLEAQTLDGAALPLLRHWRQHQQLVIRPWQPSVRAVAVAEQIIQLAREGKAPVLLLSRALELVHEALQSLVESGQALKAQSAPPVLGLREHQRLMRLKAVLDSETECFRPLADIARDIGLSPSALQRQFRQVFGSSMDEYRRDQRLERAWAQLEQTGRSVSEVAHAAGYTSAANFSTAFKRRYGISPKWVRGKI